MDRLPARISSNSRFKVVSHLYEELVYVWRYMHPYQKKKEMKKRDNIKELETIKDLNTLINKESLTVEEQSK